MREGERWGEGESERVGHAESGGGGLDRGPCLQTIHSIIFIECVHVTPHSGHMTSILSILERWVLFMEC